MALLKDEPGGHGAGGGHPLELGTTDQQSSSIASPDEWDQAIRGVEAFQDRLRTAMELRLGKKEQESVDRLLPRLADAHRDAQL